MLDRTLLSSDTLLSSECMLIQLGAFSILPMGTGSYLGVGGDTNYGH